MSSKISFTYVPRDIINIPVRKDVLSIVSHLEGDNSYTDSKPYEETIYNTNKHVFDSTESIHEYMLKICKNTFPSNYFVDMLALLYMDADINDKSLDEEVTLELEFKDSMKAYYLEDVVASEYPSANISTTIEHIDDSSIEPVPQEKPTFSTSTKITEGDETPTIQFTSNKTFASSPSSEDLGLDFGQTKLSFSSASGGSTSCSVTTTGTATVGTIKAKAKPSAFEPSENLEECDEISIQITPLPEPKVITKVPEGSKTFSGKRADEIQTGVVVSDTEVTGTLNYFEDFQQAFPANESLQHGNYLVLEFTSEPQETKIEVELQGGETVMKSPAVVDDGWCIFHVTSTEQKLHVIGTYKTKKFDKIYSLSQLVLKPKPVEAKVTSVKIAGQDQSWKGVNYSDLMSEDTQAKLSDKKIDITGTLYKYTGTELGTNAKDKNCAVVNITVDKEGTEVTATKIDGSEFNYTYSGKTSDDFVIPFDAQHKTMELTFYANAENKQRKEGGVKYTVDASNATLETRTKSEINN